MGLLAGIARRARPKGPMEELKAVGVTREAGLAGDCRGAIGPGGRGRRQVSLIEARHWAAAIAELGVDLAWSERRANLLVIGVDLRQTLGLKLRVGTALIEITERCDPCRRLEALAPGLKAALTPDWRGGVLARVIEDGSLTVGDEISLAKVAGE